MLTEKDYCDYDTCVALKELGYKVPTSAYYIPNDTQLFFVSNPLRGGYVIDCFYSRNSLPKDVMTSNYIDAPTMWEAQKWLRESKDTLIVVCPYTYNVIDETHTWTCEIWFGDNLEYEFHNFKSYEEALSKGIKEAVKLLKEE